MEDHLDYLDRLPAARKANGSGKRGKQG
jgi:hypothetical protein